MARLNVNPTRMELSKLKKQLATARRGHKLLKDKNDELMKQFLDKVKENKALRRRVEEKLSAVAKELLTGSASMSEKATGEAFFMSSQSVSVSVDYKNIMSVKTPSFHFHKKGEEGRLPYGFGGVSGEIDKAVYALMAEKENMLSLAQIEKTTQLLSREIEKTRRRVNALEHVLIPRYEETIRYITMKLEENERGNITRLMKVKDMHLNVRG